MNFSINFYEEHPANCCYDVGYEKEIEYLVSGRFDYTDNQL